MTFFSFFIKVNKLTSWPWELQFVFNNTFKILIVQNRCKQAYAENEIDGELPESTDGQFSESTDSELACKSTDGQLAKSTVDGRAAI